MTPFPDAPAVVLVSTVTVCVLVMETVSPFPGTPTSFQVVWPLALQLPVALLVKVAPCAAMASSRIRLEGRIEPHR